MSERDLTEDIKILIRKRGTIKSKITCFQSYIHKIDFEFLTDTKVIELQQRLAYNKLVIDEFNEVQGEIDLIVDENELSKQYTEREAFETAFFSVTSLAEKMLIDFRKREMQNSNASLPVFQQSPGAQSSASVGVKLPEIKNPIFDGHYESWLEFRDTFNSIIHNNPNIGNIQKYHYLRAALQGSAAQALQAIEFTENNYVDAWKAVCERYDNPRILVNNHVKEIFELEPIFIESSIKIRNLIENVSKHLIALEKMNEPVNTWDTLIIYIISQKLDKVTVREWEKHKIQKKAYSFKDFKAFLIDKANLLETIDRNRGQEKVSKYRGNSKNLVAGFESHCPICKGNHKYFNCQSFLKLSVPKRIEKVLGLRLCVNCFRPGHIGKVCKYGCCKKCNGKHNSILHLDNSDRENHYKNFLSQGNQSDTSGRKSKNAGVDQTIESDDNSHINTVLVQSMQTDVKSCVPVCVPKVMYAHEGENQILLSTVLVNVFDLNNISHPVRAVLDSGAQSSFITSDLCQRLNLPIHVTGVCVSGLSGIDANIQGRTHIKFGSQDHSYMSDISCLVIPKITDDLPNYKVNMSNLHIPRHFKLADPSFHIPGPIDMLIGGDMFWNLIHFGKQYRLDGPVLQNTVFGWIIAGPLDLSADAQRSKNIYCNFSKSVDIQDQLQQFWQIEEVSSKKPLSSEEIEAENHFVKNTKRDLDGRFIVRLPLLGDIHSLGESKQRAIKQFERLERRLQNNSNLKIMYVDFLDEYESLGHMSNVTDQIDLELTNSYYIPHHAVFKDDSSTTKCRVVFNASMPTSSGRSLNDIQMTGPTIQDDLVSILLRFRMHQFVVAADVKKMYRQVLVDKEDRRLQRIFWRKNSEERLQTFELNTVTYGTKAGSFLAIRCLKQLALDCRENQPAIADAIESDFYVDDLLTGADSVEEASSKCKQISEILQQGCFELRKWQSNDQSIIKEFHINNSEMVLLGSDEKTLGLMWYSSSDSLSYKINLDDQCEKITKRILLSSISKLFDPLGLVSPCIIYVKVILQKLWLLKLSWDEILPSDVQDIWLKFKAELPELNHLSIPRKAVFGIFLEFHCFCDASTMAYGGCVYVKSIDAKGNIIIRLLCAKSKVAPLKTLSVPRLELCGALLVSRLANKVFESLKLPSYSCFFWTDSTIVLGWIRTAPYQLKTFVGNRVAEIQTLTKLYPWNHVSTKQNPADLLSRGVMPVQLKNSSVWWEGPSFLYEENGGYLQPNELLEVELPELRTNVQVLSLTISEMTFPFERFSKFNKLKRVVAWILRFKTNCFNRNKKITGQLTVKEIQIALNKIMQIVQIESFPKEYNNLLNKIEISHKSHIFSLSPFFEDNIIRVGGRLKNSYYNKDKKHPILIPPKHYVTKLILRDEHLRLFHAGPQAVLASVREVFWPVSGRNMAKKVVRECVRCFRYKSVIQYPIMGELPSVRVHPGFPFEATGVDYAGPYYIKNHKGRGSKKFKCWICLFVCLKTRAVHLELVTELSTNGFMSAFRRFVSRRGKPNHVYSDNGTNFVGACAELRELLNNQDFCNQLQDSLASDYISWHFIPPRAPHMGSMWENGVKSCKHHLRRVMGDIVFTFEELYTLLTQIEAILNSRPLCPMSADPNDLAPLTPSHFLLGKPATSLPDPDVSSIAFSRLTRFQMIQKIQQHFWQRWQKEYINELQQRHKWQRTNFGIQLGDMVLVKEDNLLPKHWKLGRVCRVYPGKDGVCRVADVKTYSGMIRRAFSKLCVLPFESADSDGVKSS